MMFAATINDAYLTVLLSVFLSSSFASGMAAWRSIVKQREVTADLVTKVEVLTTRLEVLTGRLDDFARMSEKFAEEIKVIALAVNSVSRP